MRRNITFQLFAKAPIAGFAKTRLHSALTPAAAATLHARLVEHAAAAIADACDALPGATAELWCAPDISDSTLRAIAARYRLSLHAQVAGDLGVRMRTALHSAMPGLAILIGSDCPALDATMLLRAAGALADHDAVFVPTEDGGYALIGCRDRVPDCLAEIRWSTDQVMAATRTALMQAQTRWTELPTTWDVDTAADLARLASDVRFSPLLAGLVPQAGAADDNQFEQSL